MGVYWAKPTLDDIAAQWAKPTLDDIAAQRAVIERGEEIWKAAKQAEERERLRDTFAAAALTGYTANPAWDDVAASIVAEQAYADADAMLRERPRTGQTDADTPPQSRAGKNVAETVQEVSRCTERENDHDAAPDARAASSPLGNPVAAGLGTGNTPEPVGWVLRHSMYGPHHDSFYPTKATAEAAARMSPAWTLIPLYRSPALTAEEREAVEQAIDAASGMAQAEPWAVATLRKLLERLNT